MNQAFSRTLGAILVATVLLLAGCAGKKNDVPPESTQPVEPIVTNDTGAISGLVVSEEVVGIARAELLIRETQQSTRSDQDGRFALNGIAPGSYNVLVAALGYESQGALVEVVAGEITEKTFTMMAIVVKAPYHESKPFAGHFECSMAAIDVVWIPCGPGELAGEEGSKIEFTKPLGVTYIVAELHWTQASAGTGQNLDFNIVQKDRASEQWYANEFGPAPLKITIEVGEQYSNPDSPGGGVGSSAFDQVIDDEDTELQVDLYSSPIYADEMFPGTPREALVGVTLEQRFEGYITLFYDEVPPEEFTAFGDA